MDAIHEYLLLKGVQAAAVHGGKDQEDRIKAIAEYRCGYIEFGKSSIPRLSDPASGSVGEFMQPWKPWNFFRTLYL